MVTVSSRSVPNNELIRDQVDFFQPDSFTRITGLGVSQVSIILFFNNVAQPWPLVNGSTVTDIQVAGGSVYWNEIPGTPGYYSVRFMPNAVGYWRLSVSYAPGTQVVLHDFDVIGQTGDQGGLRAMFFKSSC